MNPSADPTDAAPGRLPRNTTPTWEVELLISGVAVFAMLQLPGWLDDAWFALWPRLDTTWEKLLLLMYFYAKSAVLILAATFVIHLLMRAHWIALVGMHSVYPDGIKWERLRIGPLQRQVESERYGSPAAVIERADNRATTVFAIGVMLASILLLVSLAIGFTFGLVMLVGSRFDRAFDAGTAMAVATLLLVVPALLVQQLDRWFGARLRPDSAPARAMRSSLRLASRLGMGRASIPTLALLSSHDGERRSIAMTLLVFVVAVLSATWAYSAMRAPDLVGNYRLFPAADTSVPRVLDAAHYDDQRNPRRDPAVPYIPAAIVRGPYLPLVVPFEPRRDNPALRRACPAAAGEMSPARRLATLDCLQRLRPVFLDGVALEQLQYDTGSDPRTDRPALLAMIDVRALAPGRHELTVGRPPTERELAAAQERAGDAAQPGVYRIAFWR